MPQDYPVPRFHFQVEWGGSRMNFLEVTGLVIEREVIEYRHSDSKYFKTIIMPGLEKNHNIILKRGVIEQDFDFYNWWNEISNERANHRRDVIIKLLNEKHEPVMAWKAMRCFPVKLIGPDLRSDANEAAIEALEIAHEGLSLMKT